MTIRFSGKALRAAALGAVLLALPLQAAVIDAQGSPGASRAPSLEIRLVNRTAKAAHRATTDTLARPGDVLEYRLVFINHGSNPIRRVIFTDGIPAGTRYIDGSASPSRTGAQVEFSVDGGRTYSLAPVDSSRIGGRLTVKPMDASLYSHVRWSMGSPLAPGDSTVALFRVAVDSKTALR